MNVDIDTIRRNVTNERERADELLDTATLNKPHLLSEYNKLRDKCDEILNLINQFVLTNDRRLIQKIQDKYQKLLAQDSSCKIDGLGDYGLIF